MSDNLDAITGLFKAHGPGKILVVTGAGISLASGIPTFRGQDPGAIWKKDVTELGTFRYFSQDPVGSWRWYLSRFAKTVGARPNPAHTALVSLENFCERQGRPVPWMMSPSPEQTCPSSTHAPRRQHL